MWWEGEGLNNSRLTAACREVNPSTSYAAQTSERIMKLFVMWEVRRGNEGSMRRMKEGDAWHRTGLSIRYSLRGKSLSRNAKHYAWFGLASCTGLKRKLSINQTKPNQTSLFVVYLVCTPSCSYYVVTSWLSPLDSWTQV